MSKAPSLNEIVAPDVILQAVGSNVKQLPAITTCPWGDGSASLHLYPDGGGVWAHSPELDFHGDGIDVLSAVFNVRTPMQALNAAEQTGLRVDRTRVTADMYASRAKLVVSRNNAAQLFTDANRRMLARSCSAELAAAMCALPTGNDMWARAFGMHVGACTTRELSSLLGVKVPIRAPEVIILPFYDLPGRISLFRVFYMSNNEVHATDIQVEGSSNSGIALAGNVHPDCKTVLVMKDPLAVFRYQRARLKFVDVPLGMVCTAGQLRYWPLYDKQVVFWDSDASEWMYRQARAIPYSNISVHKSTLDVGRIAGLGDIHGWLNYVLTDALPWPEAMRYWLLSMPVEHAEALMLDLDLTPEEKSRVYLGCAEDDRKRLDALFRGDAIDTRVQVGSAEVIQRNHQWVHSPARGHTMPVLNASFRVLSVVRYKGLGLYLRGDVTFGGDIREFVAPLDTFSQNPFLWLRDFLLDQGAGLLQSPKAWQTKLFDVATSFYPVSAKQVSEAALVGWSPTRDKFHFEKSSVVAGNVHRAQRFPEGWAFPASEVVGNPIQPGVLGVLSEIKDSNRYFWTLFGVVCRSIACSYAKSTSQPVCGYGNITLLRVFAGQLGLRVYDWSKKPCDLPSDFGAHDIPDVLITAGKGTAALERVAALGTRNMILLTSEACATLLPQDRWDFLPVTGVSSSLDPSTKLHELICRFVRTLQGSQAVNRLCEDPLTASLELISEWVASRVTVDKSKVPVILEAGLLIRPNTVTGVSVPPHKRWFHGLFALLHGRALRAVTADLVTGTKIAADVVEDAANGVMRVDETVFSMFPCGPGLLEVIQSAKKRDIELVRSTYTIDVPTTVWRKEHEDWKRATVRV